MKSALPALALTILLASSLAAQQNPAPGAKKLYIEPHIKSTTTRFLEHTDELGSYKTNDVITTRNVSLQVTNDVKKQCPSLVTVTDSRDGADYVLHIASRDSTLTRPDGTVAYSSKAKCKKSKLAKDVCSFLATQK